MEESLLSNENIDNTDEYVVYSSRWFMVLLFVLSGMANAIVLLTFAPISDKASSFWSDIGITAVNLLAVMFQICYIPGTALALYISKHYDLKKIMLAGGLLTTFGCVVRWIGGYSHEYSSLSSNGSYIVVLVGTIFCALAQPFYLNMPARIASSWFAVKERDFATTICSLANPLGSAIGSAIPAMFVTGGGENDDGDVSGVSTLLLLQLIIAAIAFLLTIFLFQSAPPTPPSVTSDLFHQSAKVTRRDLKNEFFTLMSNSNYVILLFSFTIALGNLNAIAALLNQLPGSFSNEEVGLTGFALILSGFLGAFVTGIFLEKTKAYRPILKFSYAVAVLFWLIFMGSSRSGNVGFFIASAAILGLFFLPISKCYVLFSIFFIIMNYFQYIVGGIFVVPSSIVNAVESSYPVGEDLALGLLYIGANTMAIPMTFIGQILLAEDPDSAGPSPLFPYAIWSVGSMAIGLVAVLLYNGNYLRLERDTSNKV